MLHRGSIAIPELSRVVLYLKFSHPLIKVGLEMEAVFWRSSTPALDNGGKVPKYWCDVVDCFSDHFVWKQRGSALSGPFVPINLTWFLNSNLLEIESAPLVYLGDAQDMSHVRQLSYSKFNANEESYGFSFGDFCSYFLHLFVKSGLIYISIICNKM